MKQKLEGDPDAANPHDPQLPGAPPPKQENEQKDRTIEAQAQEIEQLRMANTALLQAAGPVNLSDVKYDPSLFGLGSLSDLGVPDLSAWRASPTPSVKSEGAHSTQTCPYGA